jgi:hypothetical protein
MVKVKLYRVSDACETLGENIFQLCYSLSSKSEKVALMIFWPDGHQRKDRIIESTSLVSTQH